jgi:hypothetical protein
MKKFTSTALLFLPALLLFSTVNANGRSTPGKDKYDLSYKMSTGESFSLKTEASTVMITSQGGQDMTVEMSSANETLCRVLAASPEGIMNMQMEYKSMKQSAKSPMGDNDTDYSSWIGKKVQFSLTPKGTVSDYTGFDQLPTISGATGEKITGEMTQKGMINQFFELPDHAVKKGDTWTVATSTDIPYASSTLKSEVSTVYTVGEKVKMDGLDCLKIDAVSTQKLSGEFEQQGTQIELTRDTKSTEVIYFALEKGMYISIEATSVGNTQIYIPAAAMTIPQEIKSKQSLKVAFN